MASVTAHSAPTAVTAAPGLGRQGNGLPRRVSRDNMEGPAGSGPRASRNRQTLLITQTPGLEAPLGSRWGQGSDLQCWVAKLLTL